ncbi:unnamed protein product [Darwinula stevensoni]|uniref:Neurogenic mastermind-like N-terminal domain-containing protein n=1 Tax=Darwinula stevensoni TaxID=69355 RepID=A0A7R8XB02_9CRUS|nr:unnamed protein product [Darwinula stevensoni]CAG0890791.1 unnamed protein product [Darwinula stevensoni]
MAQSACTNMGDLLPPRRQMVVERLKRRMECYRGRQLHCLKRDQVASRTLLDQNQQQTQVLRQRFLEQKAKKCVKKSNSDVKKNVDAVNSTFIKPPHPEDAATIERSTSTNNITGSDMELEPVGVPESYKTEQVESGHLEKVKMEEPLLKPKEEQKSEGGGTPRSDEQSPRNVSSQDQSSNATSASEYSKVGPPAKQCKEEPLSDTSPFPENLGNLLSDDSGDEEAFKEFILGFPNLHNDLDLNQIGSSDLEKFMKDFPCLYSDIGTDISKHSMSSGSDSKNEIQSQQSARENAGNSAISTSNVMSTSSHETRAGASPLTSSVRSTPDTQAVTGSNGTGCTFTSGNSSGALTTGNVSYPSLSSGSQQSYGGMRPEISAPSSGLAAQTLKEMAKHHQQLSSQVMTPIASTLPSFSGDMHSGAIVSNQRPNGSSEVEHFSSPQSQFMRFPGATPASVSNANVYVPNSFQSMRGVQVPNLHEAPRVPAPRYPSPRGPPPRSMSPSQFSRSESSPGTSGNSKNAEGGPQFSPIPSAMGNCVPRQYGPMGPVMNNSNVRGYMQPDQSQATMQMQYRHPQGGMVMNMYQQQNQAMMVRRGGPYRMQQQQVTHQYQVYRASRMMPSREGPMGQPGYPGLNMPMMGSCSIGPGQNHGWNQMQPPMMMPSIQGMNQNSAYYAAGGMMMAKQEQTLGEGKNIIVQNAAGGISIHQVNSGMVGNKIATTLCTPPVDQVASSQSTMAGSRLMGRVTGSHQGQPPNPLSAESQMMPGNLSGSHQTLMTSASQASQMSSLPHVNQMSHGNMRGPQQSSITQQSPSGTESQSKPDSLYQTDICREFNFDFLDSSGMFSNQQSLSSSEQEFLKTLDSMVTDAMEGFT